MKTKKTKFYIHNFDGNLIGPEEGAIDYSAPELRHMAYEFASEDDAREAHERLLGWGHGGVISEDGLEAKA